MSQVGAQEQAEESAGRPGTGAVAAALEFRVLGGPQSGARASLPRVDGWELHIGPAAATPRPNDVVLFGTVGARFAARREASTDILRLRLLDGQAELGDAALDPGSERPWPMYVPLRVGDVSLSFGDAAQAEWSPPHPPAPAPEAAATASAAPPRAASANTPPQAQPVSALTATLAPRAPASHWQAKRLALVGATLIGASALLMALVHGLRAPATVSAEHRVAAALQAAEFKGLRLGTLPDGRVKVQGTLGSAAARARLDATLASLGVASVVEVEVPDALAQQVAEIFRLNGIEADAVGQGGGAVEVHTRSHDEAALKVAKAAALRDVPHLAALKLVNQAPPVIKPRPSLQDDPGKRITAVVAAGKVPYFVTADGGRYFVGAMLPSGHRVVSIENKTVALERDGERLQLNL